MSLPPMPYQQIQATFTDVISNVFAQGTVYNFLAADDPTDGSYTQYGTSVGVISQKENMFLPGGSITGPVVLDVQTTYLYIPGNVTFTPQVGDQIQLATDATQSWKIADVINWQPIPGLTMAYQLRIM